MAEDEAVHTTLPRMMRNGLTLAAKSMVRSKTPISDSPPAIDCLLLTGGDGVRVLGRGVLLPDAEGD